jgi:hypothetical protein
MEIGQSYLEQLRDQPFTGGLLPKVIAAYNAGPTPVANWNAMIADGGDPLLYIESIPYWETRGYVMTVLRNYWMYENQEGRKSTSRRRWRRGCGPKFPGPLQGATAVKLSVRHAAFRQDVAMPIDERSRVPPVRIAVLTVSDTARRPTTARATRLVERSDRLRAIYWPRGDRARRCRRDRRAASRLDRRSAGRLS